MNPTHSTRRRLLAGVAIALTLGGAAAAQSVFTAPDRAYAARVSFASAERGTPIVAGSMVNVTGEGFKAGQSVGLFYGSTALEGGALTADAEGKVAGKITVPANASIGTHPIVVVAQGPYNSAIAPLKVSPNLPLSAQANYDVFRAPLVNGLYQSAYSANAKAIFVTASSGRPPIADSSLLKVDPQTLKIVARVNPAAAPQRQTPQGPAPGGVYAVYGVGVDDSKQTVWVTNTRNDTVAVYRQGDLSLIKQFPVGMAPHSRDVLVDTSLNKAFVSQVFEPQLLVIDTNTLEESKRIPITSGVRGQTFSASAISLDQERDRVFVVSHLTNEVAIINGATGVVEKVMPVPGAGGTFSTSYDPVTNRLFVSAQGSDNVTILNPDTGAVIADTPVGAGALNVIFDPVSRRAYVSNRGAGTVTVLDTDGKVVGNLGPVALANHASIDGLGNVYVVNKGAAGPDEDGNAIVRIRAK